MASGDVSHSRRGFLPSPNQMMCKTTTDFNKFNKTAGSFMDDTSNHSGVKSKLPNLYGAPGLDIKNFNRILDDAKNTRNRVNNTVMNKYNPIMKASNSPNAMQSCTPIRGAHTRNKTPLAG